jgi:hypothetical protein
MSTSTYPAPEQQVIIFDLGKLKLEWAPSKTGVSIYTSSRRLLTTWEKPSEHTFTSDREAAFEALDHLLGVELHTSGIAYRVGLYNPYTTQVALQPVPLTLSYSDTNPLRLGDDGEYAELLENELLIGTRVLTRVELGIETVSEALAAHRS